MKKAKKIFLGGTCAETTWRDELIPELTKRGIEYFNPVVSDWTPDCIVIEDHEKQNVCGTHLYLITPEMQGVYSIAEAVDSAWRAEGTKDKVILAVLGDEKTWGTPMWKSLGATIKLVNDIPSDTVKASYIENVLDVLELL